MIAQSLFHVAEVEITYRNPVLYKDRLNVITPRQAYDIFSYAWDYNRIGLVEEFKILLLKGNKCIGISDIALGGTAACPVDPKIVFVTALKANASAIVMAHNHPSGNLKPSDADLSMTYRLFEGGKLLDIEVLDHLILTSNSFVSLSEEGLMPVGCKKLKPD